MLRAIGLTLIISNLGSFAQASAQTLPLLTKLEQNQILATSARVLDSLYVDRTLAKAMSSRLRRDAKTGRWDALTQPQDFADSITAMLRALAHDQHLRLSVDAKDPRLVENVTDAERVRRRNEMLEDIADMNYGITEARILPGNVGLLRVDNFIVPRLGADALAAAMTLMNHSRALIIDLRQNGGGHSDQFVLMMSYFLGEPVMLGETFSRADSSIVQTWSYAAVPGPRYASAKPVFVLTARETFSAAEALGAALRKFRKAIIVGDTTRGGGHMGDFQPVGERFLLFVPASASTHADEVEGRGLRPDRVVPSARALEEAHALALHAILSSITDEGRRRSFEGLAREADSLAAARAKP